MKHLLRLLVIITISYPLSAMLSSCTQDAYEKGEGTYSLMRGDFAEANVNSNREVTSITTDDGEILPLTSLATAQWISRPDTIYRCMLYYNKVKAADGKPAAEVISLGRVPCLYVKSLVSFEKTYKDDPVKFESIWNSKSQVGQIPEPASSVEDRLYGGLDGCTEVGYRHRFADFLPQWSAHLVAYALSRPGQRPRILFHPGLCQHPDNRPCR